MFLNTNDLRLMQGKIDLFKWIVKLSSSEKLFAILFLIIIAEGGIIYKNAQNYRRDVSYYRDRLDHYTSDCEKKISACHNENKKEYAELLQKYKELYNETLKMK